MLRVARRNPNRAARHHPVAAGAGAVLRGIGRGAARYVGRVYRNKRKPAKKTNKSKEDPFVANQYSAGIVLKTVTKRRSKKGIFKYVKVATNDCTYQWIEATLVAASEGLQAPTAVATMCNSTKILALVNVASSQVNTAGTVLTESTSNAFASATKFFLKSEKQIVKMSNQAPSTVTVRIYHLISKVTKVALSNPATDWSTGITNEDTYQSVNQGNAAAFTYPSSKPTASKIFNINWKIENVKTAQLMPGQEIVDLWTFSHNKVIDAQYFQLYGQVRGITCVTMVVVVGNLVDTSQTLGSGSISIAPAKVICSAEHTIMGCGLNAFQKSTFQETSPYGTADANIFTVNVESGLPVNVNTATNYA